jgi:hypothetical protein
VIFSRKNFAIKNRQNGKILPNLVTLPKIGGNISSLSENVVTALFSILSANPEIPNF